MLSQCLIFDTKGVVKYHWTPSNMSVNVAPVNAFILDVLINESNSDGTYIATNDYVKYLRSNKLLFVLTYPKLVTVKNTEELLKRIKLKYEQEEGSKGEIDLLLNTFDSQIPVERERNEDDEEEEEEEEEEKEHSKKKGKATKATKAGKNGKKNRKWNDQGMYYDDNEDLDEKELDFSNDKSANSNIQQSSANLEQLVGSKNDYGSLQNDGKFVIKDLSETVVDNAPKGVYSGLKKMWGQYVGGGVITSEDLKNVKGKVIEQLVKKNVSNSVCESLMTEVENTILGQRRDKFTSLETIIKNEMSIKLRKLLTPNTSINLLSEIESKNDPYVISVVGVNGVGKSTNLSKLAFWLLQNNYKVLIAACDTFRSGAVEQLRVHVNNLSKLSNQKIELFELGYGGKDLVSKIAKGAIKYAKDNQFDVVLMDTAGRRHNDTQLMAPLASFAKVANPDKIIMVGEALVGSDSVMQARNFNNAFGKGRTLDAFIVSKCDTVGGQLGSIVDLVYATKVPVLFVGVGQTYTDLRVLSVEWVINQLLD